MKRYIAILRGINVGGHRKILMADLKELLFKNDFLDVKTYIQSGNVFFSLKKEIEELNLASNIEKLIHDKFGYDVPVIIRNHDELIKDMNKNPYVSDNDTSQLYVTFLKDSPSKENLTIMNSLNFHPDKFTIIGKTVFLLFKEKAHTSKLSNNIIENKLNVGASTRNWKTVLKLIELSQ